MVRESKAPPLFAHGSAHQLKLRYLITGTGLVGAAIAEALGNEHDLVLFDLAPKTPAPPGDIITGDIRDLDAVQKAARGVDGIFHTAALHGIHVESHTPSEFMEINVLGTFNALEAAQREGVRRVVHSSTVGVAGSASRRNGGTGRISEDAPRLPRDYYGTTKLLAEDLCDFYLRAKDLEVIALRYGGVSQLVASLLGLDLEWALSGHLTDLRDVVAANVAAMSMSALPPRLGYFILPTTLLDETKLERNAGDVRAALVEALPDLKDRLPEEVPAPKSFFDASITEAELGVRCSYGQEDFVREALA